jgi:hypothetical protein
LERFAREALGGALGHRRRSFVLVVHDALDDIERDRHRPSPDETHREPVVIHDLIARDPQMPPVLEDDEGGGGRAGYEDEEKQPAPRRSQARRAARSYSLRR